MLFAFQRKLFPQDNDADLDRLEARLRGLLLRGREEDEVDFAVLDLSFVFRSARSLGFQNYIKKGVESFQLLP